MIPHSLIDSFSMITVSQRNKGLVHNGMTTMIMIVHQSMLNQILRYQHSLKLVSLQILPASNRH
jgi:hypothetical protein